MQGSVLFWVLLVLVVAGLLGVVFDRSETRRKPWLSLFFASIAILLVWLSVMAAFQPTCCFGCFALAVCGGALGVVL